MDRNGAVNEESLIKPDSHSTVGEVLHVHGLRLCSETLLDGAQRGQLFKLLHRWLDPLKAPWIEEYEPIFLLSRRLLMVESSWRSVRLARLTLISVLG